MRKRRVVGRIHGINIWKGHKGIHRNRIKRSGQARLVYVWDINGNIPTTKRSARGWGWGGTDPELALPSQFASTESSPAGAPELRRCCDRSCSMRLFTGSSWHFSLSNFFQPLPIKICQLDRSNASDPSWAGFVSHHFMLSFWQSSDHLCGRPWTERV